MSKKMYTGVGDTARKVKNIYVGVDNVARKIKRGYIGVDGIARQFYTSEITWNKYNAQSNIQHNPLFSVLNGYTSIISSPDGNTWNTKSSGLPSSWKLLYINGSYFLIPTSLAGVVYTSPDCVTWTYHQICNFTINSIDYGYGMWIVFGSIYHSRDDGDSTCTSYILTSYDFVTFTQRVCVTSSYLEQPDTLIFGNNQFIAQSDIHMYKSSDGINWSQGYIDSNKVGYLSPMVYGNGIYLVSDGLHCYYSSNSTTWNKGGVIINYNNATIKNIFFVNGHFIRTHAYNYVNSYSISTDGLNWTTYTLSGASNINSMVYGNGIYMGFGADGNVYTSIDLINWNVKAVGTGLTIGVYTDILSYYYSQGGYVGQVFSDNVSQYPDNGYKDGYWYVKQV